MLFAGPECYAALGHISSADGAGRPQSPVLCSDRLTPQKTSSAYGKAFSDVELERAGGSLWRDFLFLKGG
jgi:hypothetical protein